MSTSQCSPRTGKKTVQLCESKPASQPVWLWGFFLFSFYEDSLLVCDDRDPRYWAFGCGRWGSYFKSRSSRVWGSVLLFELICTPACLTLLFKIVPRRTERKESFRPEMQMGPSQTHLLLTLNVAFHSDIVTMQPEGQLSITTQLLGWSRLSRGEEFREDGGEDWGVCCQGH